MQVRTALLSLVTLLFMTAASYAQPSHPHSPHDTVRTNDYWIAYGRPYKKGRDIYGGLVPYGKVDRLGADENTVISFSKDVTFGGKPVKAGTYSMFAIPTENSWTIILNGNAKQWGAFDYDKNKDKDVLRVEVPTKKLDNVVEQLTMKADESMISIQWDKTGVVIPVKS
ncbi:MAG TPA: DUF2911 domain-containing protein [Puia sp.]|nr:DUF2911 domain-containing protein [Puia sp.]